MGNSDDRDVPQVGKFKDLNEQTEKEYTLLESNQASTA